jgi:hypothetical protein
MENKSNIITYHTTDDKASVALYAKDGMVWMNQNQLAELFDTSVHNISMQLTNILKECELSVSSVIKEYLTTASESKKEYHNFTSKNKNSFRHNEGFG